MKQSNAEIQRFLETLEKYRRLLTRQEVKTIRGQALSGDLDGAKRGFTKLVARGGW